MTSVLVVTPVELDAELLERRVREHAGADAEIRVVVPAAGVSPFEWLTNDEDAARAEADAVAARTEAATGPHTHAFAGDTDPVQAVEDALRTGPADELLIVTRPDAEADWLEGGSVAESLRRFRLPIVHVVVSDGGTVEPAAAGVRPVSESHEIARGADEATPARLLGRVGALVLGAALLVIVVVVLIVWLV